MFAVLWLSLFLGYFAAKRSPKAISLIIGLDFLGMVTLMYHQKFKYTVIEGPIETKDLDYFTENGIVNAYTVCILLLNSNYMLT